MNLSYAFKRIFLGYAFIFVDLNIFIDLIPDILGYWMIAKGWTELCDSGLTGFDRNRQNRGRQAVLILLIVSIGEEIWRLLGGGTTNVNKGWFDYYVPETPPLFEIRWTIVWALVIFFLGIWLMANILIASKQIAEGEGKSQVVRTVERCLELLKRVYVPIALAIIFMERCVRLPDTVCGNLIRGIQELGTLIYFCFQLMLVLQIANMRKNLDCCQGPVEVPEDR
ncbi:MAG: hypothetical protein IKY08_00295 [Firmicutes bacterium]|nr:hypothetical protein [Bacillota bacterium]